MEEMEKIKVFEYPEEGEERRARFFDLLLKGADQQASKDLIEGKKHSKYIKEYLEHLKVKTIVVEYNYVDRDYLEDFSAYYVRCFNNYERKCTRLHFFCHEFSQEEFESFLDEFNQEFHDKITKEENYLGFIVIKPLPKTIFGRTCLRTYDERHEEKDTRLYTAIREYSVNLCGIKLTVKSLAFQEQDHVVSACATSALWSAFQCTAKLYQHKILSPVETTKYATENFFLIERALPNDGLDSYQIMHAIKKLDMEPYPINIEDDEYYFKNSIYSYLYNGIPIILGCSLYEANRMGEYIHKGNHAVVITGYRLEEKDEPNKDGDNSCSAIGFFSVASKISKIYVHDDQIGPFAKMEMNKEKLCILDKDNHPIDKFKLKTESQWGYIAVPEILLIPLYHKIRIPCENIYEIINVLAEIINNSIEKFNDEIFSPEWDIFLTEVNKLKTEILKQTGKKKKFKAILQRNMPRYIWRVKALCQGTPVMELFFDATDIDQGNFFIDGIVHHPGMFQKIQTVFKSDKNISDPFEDNSASLAMVQWIENWNE